MYATAPAWSIPAKTPKQHPPSGPAPSYYNPLVTTTLSKSPSWKQQSHKRRIGREIREERRKNTSPAPNAYQSKPQRNKVMGTIGRANRDKENKQNSPGPSAYTPSVKKGGPSITMLGKGLLASGKSTPGPGMYEDPSHKSKKGGKLTRQARFPTEHEKTDEPAPNAYQGKPTRPSSAHAFGRAKRMAPSAQSQIGPGQYDTKSLFETNKSIKKGYSLASRNADPKLQLTPSPSAYQPMRVDLPKSPSYMMTGKQQHHVEQRSPSPHQYSPKHGQSQHSPAKYSMGKAERMTMSLHNKASSPGPGAYVSPSFKAKGTSNAFASNRVTTCYEKSPGPAAYSPAKQFVQRRPASANMGKGKRFGSHCTLTVPAPCAYETRKGPGVQDPKFSFPKRKRLELKHEQNPGPGSYKISSTISNHQPC